MARWHVNPENGEAGRCAAEYSCPFGGSFNGHQDTKREASKMYEEYRENLFDPSGASYFYFLSDEEHEEFTSGNCGKLAEELHRQTGYPVVAVGLKAPDSDSIMWDHVAVRAPDQRILDVTGIQPEMDTAKAWSVRDAYEVVFREIPVDSIGGYLNKSSENNSIHGSDPKPTARRIIEALKG